MTVIPKTTSTGFQAENSLIQSQAPGHLIVENSSDILVFLNAEGSITYVSPSITPIIGYAPEEIVGCHIVDLVHPDDLDTMQQMLVEIEQAPNKSLSAECRFRCKDGSWRWFEGSETNLLHVPGIGAIIGNFRDITLQKLIPSSHWSDISASEHLVHFYETDTFLLDSLSDFISIGLGAGDVCIVLATQAHRENLEERLKANGLDLATASTQGKYISLDAVETLAKFMVDGLPEPERFGQVIGSIVAQAAQSHHHVRVFGELVALLWEEGNHAAAIRLEDLWNDLGKLSAFSLFCGYPMHGFGAEAYNAEFTQICNQHTHVIPAESYTALTSPYERLRAITQLQQRANSLEEEHSRLAAIVESSNDAIVGKTLKGIITNWNRAAELLFGYSAQEAIGKPITMIIPAELQQEEVDIIGKIRQGIRIQHFETVRKSKDGRLINVSLSISPIKDGTGKIIGAAKIARDITERKELEQRKDEFISMASHELKTPVTALKGFTQLLQRRFKRMDDAESVRFLVRMDTQIDKLTKLISDLLDISRMQSGELEYRMEPFDLNVLASEIVENVQGTIQTHQLILQKTAHACVFGDRDRIGQVLINLLTNAIKYSPGAEKVIVQIARDGTNVQVSIQDFGIGIDEAYHEKIFERFYQVNEPLEKTYPGLGIGLYISCEIVKRHAGRLWVQSRKGEGSTFTFCLPVLETESAKVE
jgi:PAS domain S-box-containing protein